MLDMGGPVIRTFVCGKRTHVRLVLRVAWFDSAEWALGRPPSEQGKKDLGDGMVIDFMLGDALGDHVGGQHGTP